MNARPRPPPSASARALRTTASAFGLGFLVAVVTSAGIAGERITRGAMAVALVANAAATLAAVLLTSSAMRRSSSAGVALVAQLAGVACGIGLVHLVIRHEALGAFPWLSERPAQWMNDVVAAAGLLAIASAVSDGLDARRLVLALVGVTIYRVSAPMWHLDHAPGGFHTSVQELVVAQLVAAAFALGLFRFTLDARTAR